MSECYVCGATFYDGDHAVRVPVERANRDPDSGDTSWLYQETTRVCTGCLGGGP